MQDLDLKGMTLAALRRVNTQLDTERLAEQEALRTEYLGLQADFHNRKEAQELEYDETVRKMHDSHRAEIDALEEAYKRFGVQIGALMDRRKFCQNVQETEELRDEIDKAMDKRLELRRLRRAANDKFHEDLHEYKRQYQEERKNRYEELAKREREIRQARLAIAKKYAELHEEVRKHIGQVLKEERETENATV